MTHFFVNNIKIQYQEENLGDLFEFKGILPVPIGSYRAAM